MGREAFMLESALLGLTPFVLVEVEPDPDKAPGTAYQFGIRAGGGISTRETIQAVLLQVVAEMSGAEVTLLLEVVDRHRSAIGLPPLTEAAFEE